MKVNIKMMYVVVSQQKYQGRYYCFGVFDDEGLAKECVDTAIKELKLKWCGYFKTYLNHQEYSLFLHKDCPVLDYKQIGV